MDILRDLIVGGFTMRVGDGSPYWGLEQRLQQVAHVVTLRECEENRLRNCATTEDFLSCDQIVCYSYGGATWKHKTHDAYDLIRAANKRWKILIAIAPVPDAGLLQFGIGNYLWHVEDFYDRAVFFNVDVNVPGPTSYSIKNPEAVSVKFGQSIPEARLVNVDCNELVTRLGEIEKHVRVANDPRVLDEICQLLR